MTKRIIKTKNMEIFKQFITQRYNSPESIKDPEVREQVGDMTPGCFVFVIELPDGNIEALTMHRFMHALSTMISKESAFSLHTRYLTKEERAQAQGMLNPIDNKELS